MFGQSRDGVASIGLQHATAGRHSAARLLSGSLLLILLSTSLCWSSILTGNESEVCLVVPPSGLETWAGSGVRCQGTRVVEVYLSYWGLEGSLPAAWSNFSSLETLRMPAASSTSTHLAGARVPVAPPGGSQMPLRCMAVAGSGHFLFCIGCAPIP